MPQLMKKIFKKTSLAGSSKAGHEDLKYWLKRSAQERVAAVDFLRSQIYGHSPRLQRVARVIKLSPR